MTDLRQGQSITSKAQNSNHVQETCQICYKEGRGAHETKRDEISVSSILISKNLKYMISISSFRESRIYESRSRSRSRRYLDEIGDTKNCLFVSINKCICFKILAENYVYCMYTIHIWCSYFNLS